MSLSLTEALALFSKSRSRELSSVIETLGREAVETFAPPKLTKNIEFHRAWIAAATVPATRTWALTTIIAKVPNLAKKVAYSTVSDRETPMLERFAALLALDPDPRIARAMVELYELRSPLISPTPRRELARVYVHHADDGPPHEDLAREYPKLMKELPKPAPIDRATAARVKSSEPIAKRDTGTLFAAIYADPDADGPREVLADALQEAGDPRGEFIALQLREYRGDASDELRDRAQELVLTHGKAWLGALRPIVARAEMRRGFLHQFDLAGSWSTNKWKQLAAEPMLATVEDVGVGKASAKLYAQFLTDISGTVCSARVFDKATWTVVSANQMPRLRELHVVDWRHKTQLMELIGPWLLAHPHVTRFGADAKYVDALPKAVLARLTDLQIGDNLPRAVELWADLPNLRTLRCDGGSEPIVLVREGKRQYARVLSTRIPTHPGPLLNRLPPAIKRVEVVNNATQAKELAGQFKKLQIVSVRPPSGTITGVK